MISKETFQKGISWTLAILFMLIVWMQVDKYVLDKEDTSVLERTTYRIKKDLEVRNRNAVAFSIPYEVAIKIDYDKFNPQYKHVLRTYDLDYEKLLLGMVIPKFNYHMHTYTRNLDIDLIGLETVNVITRKIQHEADSMLHTMNELYGTTVIDVVVGEVRPERRVMEHIHDAILLEAKANRLKAEVIKKELEIKRNLGVSVTQ